MSRRDRVQAAIRTHGGHVPPEMAAEVVKAVMDAPKEWDQAKADQKTIDEAIENAVAGVGTVAAAAVTTGLSHLVNLDASGQVTVTVAVSTGVMGLLKTIIRRVRNRRKHRQAYEELKRVI